MPTQPKKSSTKKTGKTKAKTVKPVSNIGGGQGGVLASFSQASGQAR